jgi:phosphatidylglycerophosphatase A
VADDPVTTREQLSEHLSGRLSRRNGVPGHRLRVHWRPLLTSCNERAVPEAPLAARLLATWFGAGFSPIAPGTVGALATLPLHFALRAWGPLPHAAATLALMAAGVWAAGRTADAGDEEDPSSVVIDEVAGVLIAMGLARPAGLAGEAAAFVAFRFFDIVKPGIIDRAQRLRPSGVGIMADDVLAGVAAGLLVRATSKLLR